MLNDEELAKIVIGLSIDIHKVLGPGLLESAYKECLFYKIQKLGIPVEKEKPLPLIFEEVKLECGYRADLLVGKKLIVETKSVAAMHDVYMAQMLTYLKLAKLRLGLLINFNVPLLKNGIKRIVR